MSELEFLHRLHERGAPIVERAVGLLWWVSRDDPTRGLTAREICSALEATGLPTQNISRLNARLAEDRRATKTGQTGGWRLHPKARKGLSEEYGDLVAPLPPEDTGAVIPTSLVKARAYLERVVYQINAAYDTHLFDCCAVMCRRLVESLIIEVYDRAGRADEIRGSDRQFLQLNGLLSYFENDMSFSTGRNALQGLRDFKKLGDLSAHNRRFNARKDDIDRVRDGLRIAVEELVHLANLHAT
jgi:hypothetical protein